MLRSPYSSTFGRIGADPATWLLLKSRATADTAGKAVVLKVDTEKYPQVAARYNVRGIPNFAVFSGGRLVMQQAGLVDHNQMEQWLRSAAS